jgi:divalent metal cation (Fe/Co/Zn/Cd) transporter
VQIWGQLYIFRTEKCEPVSVLPLPLIERSEEEVANAIRRKVEALKGVKVVSDLRVRISGKRTDVDMRVLLDGNLLLEDSHKLSLNIKKEVKDLIPNARVTVDTGPFGHGRENIWKLVKDIAEGTPGARGVHNIHIQKIEGKLCIDLHLEVSANFTVKEAHDIADRVEKKVKATNKDIAEVTVHIETATDRISREMVGIETELESYIEHLAEDFPEVKAVHGIKIRRVDDALHIVLHCHFDPNLSIKEAHEISNKIESSIRTSHPEVARIDIHQEPAKPDRPA